MKTRLLIMTISAIFALGILPAFAEESLEETISIENKTATLSGEHIGINIIAYGMFDSEDNGNLVHQLFVGETYWFSIEYQNELEKTHDIRTFVQLVDKNTIANDVVKKFDGHGYLNTSERMGAGFMWIPEYTGQFKITASFTALDDPLVGRITPQYNFVVIDRPSLKSQIKNTIPINDIICKNANHHLVERTNGKLACVYLDTAEKLDWKSINTDVVILNSSTKESILTRYKDMPEVVAFYTKYEDAQVSVQKDHVSYFAGNGDDFRVRMNLEFDKNFEIENIEFHCYVDRVHQTEVPQTFILRYLNDFTCNEYGSQRNEN